MTLIDERGRIGGRFNLVDAAAAFVLLLLVPLALGAYLLFRTPTPTLTSRHAKRTYVTTTNAVGTFQRISRVSPMCWIVSRSAHFPTAASTGSRVQTAR